MHSHENSLFADNVANTFRFLETKHKFVMQKRLETFVEYATKRVVVVLYWGRRMYEIGLEVGLHSKSDTAKVRYHQSIVFESEGLPSVMCFGNGTEESVQSALENLKKIVQAPYFEKYLRGEQQAFDDLAAISKRHSEEAMFKHSIEPMLRQGMVAWLQKDFAQVVAYFSRHEKHLSDSQRLKLEYAKKQSKS